MGKKANSLEKKAKQEKLKGIGKVYIRLSDIKIPITFKPPTNRTHIENLKRNIILGKEAKITIDKYNVLTNGYVAYLAYLELGYIGIYATRTNTENTLDFDLSKEYYMQRHPEPICEICGRRCLTQSEIQNLTVQEFTNIDRLGLQYVFSRRVPKDLINADTYNNIIGLCKMCHELKGRLIYSEPLRQVILNDLRIRHIIQ